MGVRAEQKERTRQLLVNVALDMVAEGRSFDSLSLREVTRAAGVVPTAFYRHFRNMDELGMAIVGEVLPRLRKELQLLRRTGESPDAMVRNTVTFFFDFVGRHQREFQFYGREIAGGRPMLRNTLRLETFSFTRELAEDLAEMGVGSDLGDKDRLTVADLIVRLMLTTTQDLLELHGNAMAMDNLHERTVRQMLIILSGVMQWASRSASS